MRFTEFWADILSQNHLLKWCLLSMSILTVAFASCLVAVAMREPLVFERECFTKAMTPTSSKASNEEMERFLHVAISKRFDTEALDTSVFLTNSELLTRNKEVEELVKKGMSQKVIVNSVKFDSGAIVVNADRVISMGKIRSALSLPIRVQLKSTDRSSGNPYGLILSDVSFVAGEEKK